MAAIDTEVTRDDFLRAVSRLGNIPTKNKELNEGFHLISICFRYLEQNK